MIIYDSLFCVQVLIVQALRPDRLQSAMSLFASKALGKDMFVNSRSNIFRKLELFSSLTSSHNT